MYINIYLKTCVTTRGSSVSSCQEAANITTRLKADRTQLLAILFPLLLLQKLLTGWNRDTQSASGQGYLERKKIPAGITIV